MSPTKWQCFDQFIGLIFHVKLFKDELCFVFDELVTLPVNACVKTNIFFYSQVFIQRKFLTHITDIPFDLFVFLIYIESRYSTRS